MRRSNIFVDLDWWSILIYLILITIGWVNIYAANFNEEFPNMMTFSQSYGKQFVWIITSLAIALALLIIDSKFYTTFAYSIYAVVLILLLSVLLFGTEISGARSWFSMGVIKFQPTEFAKFATALALAKHLSALNVSLKRMSTRIKAAALFIIPAVLIVLQGDAGSAIIYIAFILVLYREGLPHVYIVTGIVIIVLSLMSLMFDKFLVIGGLLGLAILISINFLRNNKVLYLIGLSFIGLTMYIFTVDFVFKNILKEHQQARINVLLGKEIDPHGAAYNVIQSKIAIGSGGFWGKGFRQGTQTKFDFVPEQSTDFIFCTIGEEHGFIGSLAVIVLYLSLLLRILFIAERQRSDFSRIYAYGVAFVLFLHLVINVGMTIGLAPVIGIPFPFISYGGSSLWGFTFLLFILIKLDADRMAVLR
ncbi:MAG: rod shape-determining protein RodA [Bacteroidetes bacterium]|nr:rod shape-determining protein RodA [Bacteroidota bacterium]